MKTYIKKERTLEEIQKEKQELLNLKEAIKLIQNWIISKKIYRIVFSPRNWRRNCFSILTKYI